MEPLETPNPTMDRLITEILVLDDDQLSEREYRYLAQLMASRGGCNFLVFGVGNDSGLWMTANAGGWTVFLESSRFWSEKVRGRYPEITIRPVQYGSERRQWRQMIEADPSKLALDLPEDVREVLWDVIFVDAPAGYSDTCPGRMKSIYTAAELAHRHRGAEVVVHDCDREVERAYCDRFFATDLLVRELERTRHYRSLGLGGSRSSGSRRASQAPNPGASAPETRSRRSSDFPGKTYEGRTRGKDQEE